MNLAVIGSRGITDRAIIKSMMVETIAKHPDIKRVVSGAARGVDSIAEDIATELGLETLIFPADWKKYGKQAGFLRNTTIIENCDIVLAIWDGASRGTLDSLKKAKALGKPCIIVDLSCGLNTDILF